MNETDKEKKVFDWSQAGYGPVKKEWLMANQNKPLTEEEFVEIWHSLPTSKGRNRKLSRCKEQYHALKDKFGFFLPQDGKEIK